ncbi:hypothetical protein [Pannonibacter phragmitetus]|uniref:hypothetical protein n=1 Tax=Pannonibacter phragmitetus TaxID=121719 RepID=UPI0013CEC6AD|nr:hypothetical protein [Pannonibacter phragmitetus]
MFRKQRPINIHKKPPQKHTLAKDKKYENLDNSGFKSIINQTPAIIAIVSFILVIVSFTYNAAFLNAASAYSAIHIISYQDIITSSLNLAPLSMVIISGLACYIFATKYHSITLWYKSLIMSIIPIIAVIMLITEYDKTNYTPTTLLLISTLIITLSFTYEIFNSVGIGIKNASIILSSALLIFGSVLFGIYDYIRAVKNPVIVTTKNCNQCLLIKAYSNAIISRDTLDGSINIEINYDSYKIKTN